MTKSETSETGLDDLATLAPIERVVTCRGEAITVRELELDQILDLVPLLQRLMPSKDELHQMNGLGAPDVDGNTEINIGVAHLFRTRRAEVYQVIALVVGKDVDWVRRLPGSQAFALGNAILETNADFIVSHALPALLSVAEMLGLNLLGGTTLSLNSAAQGTQNQ